MKPQTLVGIAATALAAAAHAQTNQTTVVRAPIFAVAIGPSHASVDVNVNNGKGKHTVYVGAPLIAVSTPLWQMHIRVN